MEKTVLTLVRHGETQWNKEGRSQGFADLNLTDAGLEQARCLAESLMKAKLDWVYSSPLKRARQTAEIIAKPHQKEVILHDNLKELNHGDLEGLTYVQMSDRFPDILDEWRRNPARVNLPGGETMEELQQRAWNAVLEIVGRHKGQNILIVSHNLCILSILCRVLDLPLKRMHRLKQDVAARTVVHFFKTEPMLVALNDRSHLQHHDSCHKSY